MDELVINYNNSPLETLSVKAVATVKNVLIYLTYWLTKRMKASKTIFTVDASTASVSSLQGVINYLKSRVEDCLRATTHHKLSVKLK